jgi:hypothetical protein
MTDLCGVLCAVCSVQCAVCGVQCAVCGVIAQSGGGRVRWIGIRVVTAQHTTQDSAQQT